MPRAPLITLTTDFGEHDGYVAQMKGVVLAICPEARLFDLCHHVPPQDVAAGAFLLDIASAPFPARTIHVAVVDPGVGTARRAVAVETERHVFVGPDNGLLGRALRRSPAVRAHVLTSERYRRCHPARTFDGRDVFAPAAAWLASGVALDAFGPPAGALVDLDPPVELVAGQPARVRVVHVDRFGNVILDVTRVELARWLGCADPPALRVEIGDRLVERFHATYAGAPPGEPFLLFGSSGHLEIAIDRGRAAEALSVRPHTTVLLRPR